MTTRNPINIVTETSDFYRIYHFGPSKLFSASWRGARLGFPVATLHEAEQVIEQHRTGRRAA